MSFHLRALVNPAPALAGFLALMATGETSAQVQYPKRGLFDESTGYVQSQVDGIWFRGSGVIARDSRLIFSCAHVVYDNGVWADRYVFHRAYNSSQTPNASAGAEPRGFRYFTGYSTNLNTYGISSSETYAYDFVIYYGSSGFGTAAGWWDDGGSVLRSSRWKRIVGYPSVIDFTGEPGYAYQHGTDWFDNSASEVLSPYHTLDDVSTGRGNSGGPLFVWDPDSEKSFLAGILVSGTPTLAGVYALSDASDSMATAALGLEPITRKLVNRSAVRLPDGASRFTTRKVKATDFSGGVVSLKCSVKIRTPRKGDLAVYLKSPAGRIHWINKPSSRSSNNVLLRDEDLTSRFKGSSANGKWSLKMKDKRARNEATFKKFSLTIEALGE